METLHERLNEIDPHYFYVMGMMGPGATLLSSNALLAVRVGDVRVEVFPRYRDATNDRPITMNLTVALGAEDAEIREALEYGQGVDFTWQVGEERDLGRTRGIGRGS